MLDNPLNVLANAPQVLGHELVNVVRVVGRSLGQADGVVLGFAAALHAGAVLG